jgi:hypothetical protein
VARGVPECGLESNWARLRHGLSCEKRVTPAARLGVKLILVGDKMACGLIWRGGGVTQAWNQTIAREAGCSLRECSAELTYHVVMRRPFVPTATSGIRRAKDSSPCSLSLPAHPHSNRSLSLRVVGRPWDQNPRGYSSSANGFRRFASANSRACLRALRFRALTSRASTRFGNPSVRQNAARFRPSTLQRAMHPRNDPAAARTLLSSLGSPACSKHKRQ